MLIRAKKQISMWCSMLQDIISWTDCLDFPIYPSWMLQLGLQLTVTKLTFVAVLSFYFVSSTWRLPSLHNAMWILKCALPVPQSYHRLSQLACGALLISPEAWCEHIEVLLKPQQRRKSKVSDSSQQWWRLLKELENLHQLRRRTKT